LDLSDNQLPSVPAELGKLSALTKLGLGGNQLTSVPAELGNLSALTELKLSRNQLTVVPAALGRLRARGMTLTLDNGVTITGWFGDLRNSILDVGRRERKILLQKLSSLKQLFLGNRGNLVAFFVLLYAVIVYEYCLFANTQGFFPPRPARELEFLEAYNYAFRFLIPSLLSCYKILYSVVLVLRSPSESLCGTSLIYFGLFNFIFSLSVVFYETELLGLSIYVFLGINIFLYVITST
jgi:hypothetical protein